jgi:oligosaccharide repeat unit polymerase
MTDVFEKCLALVFSLMILGQAYLVRRYVGTWLFPACLFGLFWFGYTFVPLSVLFWVPAHPAAIAFLFVCTVAFSMGSLAFDWSTAFARNTWKGETAALVYGSRFLKVVFCLTTLAALVFLVLNLFAQGFSLHDLIFDLYVTAAAYANLHFSGGLSAHVFDQLSMIFAYLSAILGGLLVLSAKTKIERRLVVVLSFLPSILVAVTQSAKGLLFLCLILFYAGLLVCRASAGKLRLFEKSSVKSLILYGASLMAVVTVSFLGRGLYTIEDSGDLLRKLVEYYSSYAFAHIYAFSDWFAFYIGRHSEIVYHHESAAHGFYTFMAVFERMGSHKVVPDGVFDEYYSYGGLLSGNIYTMFRGLIQDFGLIGSVLFMLLTGLLLHWSFHTMLYKRRPAFTVAVFIFMMGYFYNSFIISALVWLNIYVTFVLLWIVLQINKMKVQTRVQPLAAPEPRSGAVV